jgi:UDP-N-acetylglucosamine 2-epimerase (non-hydrolysing)
VETLEIGANRLAGTEPKRIENAAVVALEVERNWQIPFGDGTAAKKIVDVCKKVLES